MKHISEIDAFKKIKAEAEMRTSVMNIKHCSANCEHCDYDETLEFCHMDVQDLICEE